MDHEERRNSPQNPVPDWSTMSSSTSSGSARALTRNKGLAWVSGITMGAGAASALGAVAIAVSLAHPATATSASSATVATTASQNVSAASQSTGEDDSGTTLQAAPATANIPPVATSGAS